MNRLLIVTVFLALGLVGCALSDTHAVVARSASTLVSAYCKAPAPARLLLRTQIAADTAPNKVRVECADDAL
jgi:hypothetical protein